MFVPRIYIYIYIFKICINGLVVNNNDHIKSFAKGVFTKGFRHFLSHDYHERFNLFYLKRHEEQTK